MQAYDGLGPEVINSRLSMLGFAIAAFWELTQGIDIFQQVDKYPLITVATFVIFTVASWIPFMQGQSYNVKSGPFTPAVRGLLHCCGLRDIDSTARLEQDEAVLEGYGTSPKHCRLGQAKVPRISCLTCSGVCSHSTQHGKEQLHSKCSSARGCYW